MDDISNKQQKIIQARMKLRERFLKQSENTPSVSDQRPLGTGPLNRHQMPSVPKGQTLTEKFLILLRYIQPNTDSTLSYQGLS